MISYLCHTHSWIISCFNHSVWPTHMLPKLWAPPWNSHSPQIWMAWADHYEEAIFRDYLLQFVSNHDPSTSTPLIIQFLYYAPHIVHVPYYYMWGMKALLIIIYNCDACGPYQLQFIIILTDFSCLRVAQMARFQDLVLLCWQSTDIL